MRVSCLLGLRRGVPSRASFGRCISLTGLGKSPLGASYGVFHPRLPWGVRRFSASPAARFSLDGTSTIYALSTVSGRAAIAVVRVSGSACVQVRASKIENLNWLDIRRYTRHYAPRNRSPSRALRLFGHSTTRHGNQLRTRLTLELSFFTSLVRERLPGKMS